MTNIHETRLRSWSVRTCFTFFSLLLLVAFLFATLFQKQTQGRQRGLWYDNSHRNCETNNEATKSNAEAHQILVESLDLFRDILANIAAQEDQIVDGSRLLDTAKVHKLSNRDLASAFGDIIKGIGDDLLKGVSGASMYLGAGIGNGTISSIGLKASQMKKNTAIPAATGVNSVAQGLGQGLSASIVGSINITSLLPAMSGDSTNAAVLSFAKGLGGGASSGLNLKAVPAAASNDTTLAGIIGNFALGLSESFLSDVDFQKALGSLGGSNISATDTNKAALALAQGLGGGAASSLKLTSQPASMDQFSKTEGISGITGSLGLGLSTSFLVDANFTRILSGLGGNMSSSANITIAISAAAEGLGAGLGQGAVVGLGLQPEPADQAPNGKLSMYAQVKMVTQSFGRGLTQSVLSNGTVKKLGTLIGGDEKSTTIDVIKVAQGFAIGLVDGAQQSLQAAGGLGAITGSGVSTNNTQNLLTMPPSSTFNDSVMGAATGFGNGLGGQGVKLIFQALKPASSGTAAKGIDSRGIDSSSVKATKGKLQANRGLGERSVVTDVSLVRRAKDQTSSENKTIADVIDPFLQTGMDALGCQGMGGIISVFLALIPPNKLLSLVNQKGSANSSFTAALGSLGNSTFIFEIDGNTFQINAAKMDFSINGLEIIAFAVLLVLHILFGILAFSFAMPLILILNSSRHMLVLAGEPSLHADTPKWRKFLYTLVRNPKWQNLVVVVVFIPSVLITFLMGLAVEGNRDHMHSPHGVSGLVIFLLVLGVIGTWYFLTKPSATFKIPKWIYTLEFIIRTFITNFTIMSGFHALSEMTACALQFLDQVTVVTLGYFLALPSIAALTVVLVRLALDYVVPEGLVVKKDPERVGLVDFAEVDGRPWTVRMKNTGVKELVIDKGRVRVVRRSKADDEEMFVIREEEVKEEKKKPVLDRLKNSF